MWHVKGARGDNVSQEKESILFPVIRNYYRRFIHSIRICRKRRFLAVLRSFSNSPLLCTFSCHPSPPTILPSSLTSYCHLLLGLPLNLVVPRFIYNTLLGILFSSILCTCPNQCNLFNLIVSIIVGFLTLAYISLLVNILQFSFSLSYTGPKILLYTFLSKMFNCFLSLFVSVQVSNEYVNVLFIIVFFSFNFSFFDMFLFLKKFCSIKYVVLAYFYSFLQDCFVTVMFINRLTPNDPYMGRTAPLTSKRCILYIYSTNIGTEYFKHALYSPFFSLQNAVCFIILTCLVPVLFTFYIQGVLKFKK